MMITTVSRSILITDVIMIDFLFPSLETPVEFTQKLTETQADEGKTVTLECAASKPGVKITWKKDGKVITESDRVSSSSRVSKSTLTIKKVIATDAGQYEAVAPDGVSTSARLTV